MSHTEDLHETLERLAELKIEFLGLQKIEKDLEELEEMLNKSN
jgi:hypothetical protein